MKILFEHSLEIDREIKQAVFNMQIISIIYLNAK